MSRILRPSLEVTDFHGDRLTIEPDGGQLKLVVDDGSEIVSIHLDQAEQLAIIRYLLGID